MINVEGLNKAEVLAALYNNSHVQGLGILQAIPGGMTIDTAQALLDQGHREFDYLFGRVMKIDLSSDIEFEGRLYDRDVGEGAAQNVINQLRRIG